MEKRAIDRRIAHTRGMLQHALISLILKKGYEAITIEDICEAANVGRSTFYIHYTSEDSLKWSGLDENLRRAARGSAKIFETKKNIRTLGAPMMIWAVQK